MTTAHVKIGMVSASPNRGSHYDDFLALLPPEADIEIEPLGLYRDQLTELRGPGALEEQVGKTTVLVRERGWNGIAIMGAPMQVQNPGMKERIAEAVGIPVTTALESGAAALRALSVSRVLLITPFDAPMKALLKEFLAGQGIEAFLPPASFESIAQAQALTADEIYKLATDTLAATPGAEGIYFQGAPLNPLGCIDRLETDIGMPVVASNPTMFWNISSILGQTYRIESGAGRLLREWPAAG
jgi:maleate cis-trans isomerase